MTENLAKGYLKHFSNTISKELCDYATNSVFLHSRYIFTRREGKQQYGYCTHCNKEFKTTGFKHNAKEECPKCRSTCIVKASGGGRGKMIDRAYFVFYEKSVIDPKVIVARGIYAKRDYRQNYKKVETEYSDQVWYVFDMEKGSVMVKKGWSYSLGKWTLGIGKSVYSYYSKFNQSYMNLYYSRKSIEKAVEGTPFSWSGWESYDYKDMVKFFDLYSKYPCIEYLTKLDFESLVVTKLEGGPTYNAINWRGKSLFKVLKITKQELNKIKEQHIYVTFEFLKMLQMSKKDGSNFAPLEAARISREYNYYLFELEKMMEYGGLRKIINYLSKQREKYSNHFYSNVSVLTTWKDYIADCKKLGMNLEKENVVFPRDLHTAHQNTIKQIKIKANEKFISKIVARCKALKKYSFEFKGLILRPAGSPKELIEEGQALNHCVGTYAEKYAEGRTNIFFIRKASRPNKPYFTMEVSKDNRIIQTRGKNNCNPDKAVAKLIEVFEKEKLTSKKRQTKTKITIPA